MMEELLHEKITNTKEVVYDRFLYIEKIDN